jgi:hypothetical protein
MKEKILSFRFLADLTGLLSYIIYKFIGEINEIKSYLWVFLAQLTVVSYTN